MFRSLRNCTITLRTLGARSTSRLNSSNKLIMRWTRPRKRWTSWLRNSLLCSRPTIWARSTQSCVYHSSSLYWLHLSSSLEEERQQSRLCLNKLIKIAYKYYNLTVSNAKLADSTMLFKTNLNPAPYILPLLTKEFEKKSILRLDKLIRYNQISLFLI